MKEVKSLIFSLGGSMIVPDQIDVSFLRDFHDVVVGLMRRYERIFIVTGGGGTARHYQSAAHEVTHLASEDLDWLGIHSTRLNGHLLRTIFRRNAYPRVLTHPEVRDDIPRKYKIVIGAGSRPGWSTDYVAVMLASTYGVKEIYNLSNIKYIYDRDPKKYSSAQPLTQLSWDQYKKLIPRKWTPGLNLPFDPVAAQAASELHLRVLVLRGGDFVSLRNALRGRAFQGSTIV